MNLKLMLDQSAGPRRMDSRQRTDLGMVSSGSFDGWKQRLTRGFMSIAMIDDAEHECEPCEHATTATASTTRSSIH